MMINFNSNPTASSSLASVSTQIRGNLILSSNQSLYNSGKEKAASPKSVLRYSSSSINESTAESTHNVAGKEGFDATEDDAPASDFRPE
ncbi:hypothetical protein QVD17_19998 [Tagetes erecta]|uniref:Uncharacterized protein n=1 Tax=Tagetes erecta TaxID=13708 RepID=A0AAD8KKH0_TARER|nr:hypothetical protein QVD17_19998 [Tagetes erecta]